MKSKLFLILLSAVLLLTSGCSASKIPEPTAGATANPSEVKRFLFLPVLSISLPAP
jgi:hypothetical protein